MKQLRHPSGATGRLTHAALAYPTARAAAAGAPQPRTAPETALNPALPARLARAVSALAAGIALAGAAQAQEADWRLRLGPGRIAWDETVRLNVGGSAVPGAGATLSDDTALLAEIGYRFTPAWSLGVTVGVPPTTAARGTGAAAPFGHLGDVKYGPLGLTAQYQFNTAGRLRPYVGAGAVYFKVFEDRDGSIERLKVDNAWGSIVQAGVDVRLSPRLGLFLDVKKLFLDTDAHGTLPALGGAPVRADITLDPLVLQAGLVIDF